MEATLPQREQNAQLNQDRAKKNPASRQENSESSHSPLTLIVFLPLAMVADICGALDLTGFGAILVRFIDIPVLGILWLWRVLGQESKKQKQDYSYQLMLAFLAELSPFGIVPAWTTFVLYCYFKDSKLGKKTIEKLEKGKK